jgi:hypothetical protein
MIDDFHGQLSPIRNEVKYQRFLILTTTEVVVRRGMNDADVP